MIPKDKQVRFRIFFLIVKVYSFLQNIVLRHFFHPILFYNENVILSRLSRPQVRGSAYILEIDIFPSLQAK